MNATSKLQDYRTRLSNQGSPLATALDDLLQEVEAAGWKVAYFDAPAPVSAEDRADALTVLEARFGHTLPAALRPSFEALYTVSNGFSVAIGPKDLPDIDEADADLEPWEERGAIGYMLFSLERCGFWIEPYEAEDNGDPSYAEGGITQLFTSDFEAGKKPNTSAVRYSSYVGLGDDDDPLDPSSYANESYETHKLGLSSDAFPGGYLDEDGDQQPFLMLDDDEAPLATPFDAMVAQELRSTVRALIAAAD